MRSKKIWTKVLAAALCALLVFPASVFAEESGEGGQPDVQTEEQTGNEITQTLETEVETTESDTQEEKLTEKEESSASTTETAETTETETPAEELPGDGTESAEEDVLPTIGDTIVMMNIDEEYYAPITAGSGKYKASTVKMEMVEPHTGLAITGSERTITDDLLSKGLPLYVMFEDGTGEPLSGKAGYYAIRTTFLNENGEVVYEDEDSIQVYMEEDWSLTRQTVYDLEWDGSSDLVFEFDPGSGLGAITGWTSEIDTVNIYGHSMGHLYTMQNGTDFEVDLNGTLTIKGSYLQKLAREDESFGDAEFYYIDMFARMESGTQLRFFMWSFSYDRNAVHTDGDTTSTHEVTLPEENTVIPADEMAVLVEQNKESDIVIHTPSGVDFKFAKGTMRLVDGKDSYDFGTTLITDLNDSGVAGVPEDDFAFRINFNYSGTLPGKAVISISLGRDSKWIGRTLYYSQIESGEISEPICQNVVDENGVFTVEQEHCSDYVATAKDMSVKDTTTKDTADKQDTVIRQTKNAVSPKTGDTTAVFLLFAVVLVSGAVVLGTYSVKARRK